VRNLQHARQQLLDRGGQVARDVAVTAQCVDAWATADSRHQWRHGKDEAKSVMSSADLCLTKTPKRAREDSMNRPHALGDRLARLTAHWPAGSANSAVHAYDRPQSAHTPTLLGDRDL
jgi:hypothetical protein